MTDPAVRLRDLEDRTLAAWGTYPQRPVLFGREVSPSIIEWLAEQAAETRADDDLQTVNEAARWDSPSKEDDA